MLQKHILTFSKLKYIMAKPSLSMSEIEQNIISLEEAQGLSPEALQAVPVGTYIDCGDGWIVQKHNRYAREGTAWVAGKEGSFALTEDGRPTTELLGKYDGEFGTFGQALTLLQKSRDMTEEDIMKELRRAEIDEEDSSE